MSENAHDTSAPTASSKGKPQVVDEKINRMGNAPLGRLIVEFAIPSIVGMLVNGAYNLIASIFLGQAMGSIGLSVMTVATPIMTLFIALAMLVGAGGNALAALRLGQGRPDDAERSLANTVTLSLILWLVIAIGVSIPPVMDWLLAISSATPDIKDYSATFIRIISYGFIFQCIGMGVNNFIRTSGAPNRALVTMVIGAVSCTVLNYLFVLVFDWQVMGCALATIGGQALSCIAVLWFFTVSKKSPMHLHLHFMPLRADVVKMILSLGAASFAVQIGATLFNFVINYQLAFYGAIHPIGAEAALASIGVVQRVAMFTVLPLIGMSVAIQPLLGFNYGARNYARVWKALWLGVAGATVIAVVMWVLIHLFSTEIVSVFGIESQSLNEFTVFALGVQLLLLPFVGFQVVCSNYFQATGQPTKSIFLSLSRQVLFLIPLAFVLPLILPGMFPGVTGLDSLYWSVPCADFLAIFTTGVFILLERRRLTKMEHGEIASKY